MATAGYLSSCIAHLTTKQKPCFLHSKKGVLDYGLPEKVRSDKGGENVFVCSFMMNHPLRGPDTRPFITGRSLHNRQIERLWRGIGRYWCNNVMFDLNLISNIMKMILICRPMK